MEQIEGKNYLTILEVMERLNVCRQTVLRYRLSKKLDFIRLRGKIYITEESYNNMFIPESEKSTQNQKNQTAPYDREQVEETLKILLHIAQSIAIMRAIASNKVKNTQAFWLPIQGNCYDLAVIEWCKVFPPNTGYLHFKSIMPNDKDKKFEASIAFFFVSRVSSIEYLSKYPSSSNTPLFCPFLFFRTLIFKVFGVFGGGFCNVSIMFFTLFFF